MTSGARQVELSPHGGAPDTVLVYPIAMEVKPVNHGIRNIEERGYAELIIY